MCKPNRHQMSHHGCCHGGPRVCHPLLLSEEEEKEVLEKYKESLEKQLERVNDRLGKLIE